LEEKWIEEGSVVIDPFGGVCLGGLYAMINGMTWIGIELEEKFCKLGQKNIDLWLRKFRGWPHMGTARIIQGDSRRIREVVKEAGVIVSSPPYSSENIADARHLHFDDRRRVRCIAEKQKNGVPEGYGHTPGNLANLKEGKFEAVIASPPYERSLDNILPRDKDKKDSGAVAVFKRTGRWPERRPLGMDYGKNKENLGNSSGDTFWEASLDILKGCYDLLKPGGEPVPDGEGIDFCEGHHG